MGLKSYGKILSDLEFIPEKNKPCRKNVNAHLHFRVLPDKGPGFFHFRTPVNIMQDDR
jgi:hypothetical protein